MFFSVSDQTTESQAKTITKIQTNKTDVLSSTLIIGPWFQVEKDRERWYGLVIN